MSSFLIVATLVFVAIFVLQVWAKLRFFLLEHGPKWWARLLELRRQWQQRGKAAAASAGKAAKDHNAVGQQQDDDDAEAEAEPGADAEGEGDTKPQTDADAGDSKQNQAGEDQSRE